MRTGFWFSTAHSIMVRKLSSSLRPMEQFPGLMRYFANARAHVRIFLQQLMSVVMKIAHDRHDNILLASASTMCWDRFGSSSLFTVTRTISEPALCSAATCCTVEETSAVSVLVIDCTTTGASEPTRTLPIRTVGVFLRWVAGIERSNAILTFWPRVWLRRNPSVRNSRTPAVVV